jgi:peptidoglycan biosynthesis protein MviN/MurJ (putative lipid II flippase)
MTEVAAKDVRSRALAALASSAIYDLRGVQIEQHEGSLVMSGSVAWFYYKQLAQELVLGTCGKVDLINAIEVRQPIRCPTANGRR